MFILTKNDAQYDSFKVENNEVRYAFVEFYDRFCSPLIFNRSDLISFIAPLYTQNTLYIYTKYIYQFAASIVNILR